MSKLEEKIKKHPFITAAILCVWLVYILWAQEFNRTKFNSDGFQVIQEHKVKHGKHCSELIKNIVGGAYVSEIKVSWLDRNVARINSAYESIMPEGRTRFYCTCSKASHKSCYYDKLIVTRRDRPVPMGK